MDNSTRGICKYAYDIWRDGTCKCDKAHGGITTLSQCDNCACFDDDE